MSGNAQFDLHPDVESLNAFAEQALAGQERERMMAHLAMCSRCREIVFLAQKELEPKQAAAATAPTVERGPWFRNWRLAWIPLGALAAGIAVVYVTHTRHEESARQMAVVERQTSPVKITPQMAPLPEESAKRGETARKQARPEVAQAPPPAPAANEPAGALQKSLATTKTAADELKAAPERTVVLKQPEPREVARETAPMAKRADKASGENPTRERDQALGAFVPMTQNEAAAASPAVRTFGVEGLKPTSRAAYVAGQTGLPSGLAAISTAIAMRNVLAVDKAGGLFLSTNGGAHWENIGRQWSGQAVAVRTRKELKGNSDAADAGAADAGAANAGAAAAGGGSSQAGFELVNDQGQVWVSPDGRTWKAE
jgi:Putative zinc-finger